ncbi:MAG: hypothetical protein U0359_01140 [Byssovorax sp.]
MGGALAAGDLDGARVVNEAIGKLLAAVQLERPELGASPGSQLSGPSPRASGAAVVDLESERRRRGG